MAPSAPGCAHVGGAAPTPVGGDGQLCGTRRKRVATAIAPNLAAQYHVRGVPEIVMNDMLELIGAQSGAAFVEALLRSAADGYVRPQLTDASRARGASCLTSVRRPLAHEAGLVARRAAVSGAWILAAVAAAMPTSA